MQKKHFLSLLVLLLSLLIIARPAFMLLTHDFQEEADNEYFIYKHVKKRKQDFEEAASSAILNRLRLRIVKLPPVTPSLFITARTKTAISWHYGMPEPGCDSIIGIKTYLLTGKLSI